MHSDPNVIDDPTLARFTMATLLTSDSRKSGKTMRLMMIQVSRLGAHVDRPTVFAVNIERATSVL